MTITNTLKVSTALLAATFMGTTAFADPLTTETETDTSVETTVTEETTVTFDGVETTDTTVETVITEEMPATEIDAQYITKTETLGSVEMSEEASEAEIISDPEAIVETETDVDVEMTEDTPEE